MPHYALKGSLTLKAHKPEFGQSVAVVRHGFSRTISVEPFFNELLELPECAFDQFVSFVEKTMAECMSEG